MIKGKRIAWVGDAGTWPGSAAESISAKGQWAVPGFGESHKHIESSYVTPEYEAELVIPDCNTWSVEGSHELSNVVGNHNVEFWLTAEDRGSPLIEYPEWASDTIRVGRKLEPEDFTISAPAGKTEVTAALLAPFYWGKDFMIAEMPVRSGAVLPDAEREITKVALVDRYHGEGKLAKMFWKDVGPVDPKSALASSNAHDLHNIWVVGNDDEAMALAVNTIADMGGGWSLVKNGKVVATVCLEIGGLMSQRPVAEVAAELEHLYAEADGMQWIGKPGLPRHLDKSFLTCTPWNWVLVAPFEGNPHGFVNVTNGASHPVVW